MFKYNLGDGADLRILEMRHAPEFLEFVTENRDHLGRWLVWANRIHALEAVQNFINRHITHFAEDGLSWVGIWLDDSDISEFSKGQITLSSLRSG